MNEPVEPWYKQFWPWLIILLPASVVVAGFTTLYIAIKHNDSRVRDSYYKDGLAFNQELARDRIAEEAGLRFNYRIDQVAGLVSAELAGDLPEPVRSLRVDFIHPFQAEQDFVLVLARSGDRFVGELPRPLTQRWTVEITPVDGDVDWRLRGSLYAQPDDLLTGTI